MIELTFKINLVDDWRMLGQSISLKFSLETRLESESFETLIDFLSQIYEKKPVPFSPMNYGVIGLEQVVHEVYTTHTFIV